VGIEKGDAERKLQEFLMGYRSTPTTTTGQTPSELFLGRTIRTRLDVLKPDMRARDGGNHRLQERMTAYERRMTLQGRKGRQRVREFQSGEKVLVRNFPHKHKWISGRIVNKLADRTYTVDVGNKVIKRHIDHIIRSNAELPCTRNLDELYMDYDPIEQPINNEQENHQHARKQYPQRNRRPVRLYGIDN
jgi:hypothetical protein